MEENVKNTEQVDFSKYPEGFEVIAAHLDFIPDEAARKMMIWSMVGTALFY